MLRLLPVALLAMLALPAASAQTGFTPTATVQIEGLPEGTVTVNETLAQVAFDVRLVVRNLVCLDVQAQPIFTITLTAATGDEAEAGLSPEVVQFRPRSQSLSGTYEEARRVNLFVRPSSPVPDGLNTTVSVTAELPGGNAGCQGLANIDGASQTANVTLAFSPSDNPLAAPAPKEMPGPGLLIGLAAVGLALLAVRRKA